MNVEFEKYRITLQRLDHSILQEAPGKIDQSTKSADVIAIGF